MMRSTRAAALTLVTLAALAIPVRALATDKREGLSSYERDTLDTVLKKIGREVDPAAEGKTLEAVDVVTLEVFGESDGFFQIANIIHATTLPPILKREVLLRIGQRYSTELADETARNIRGLPQNSLVLVVPLKGSRDGAVRLLVLTKDVWSLRLSWDVKASSAGLDTLRLEPSETNLGGTHQTIAGRFVLRPETYTLGTAFRVPRLQGHRIAVGADINVIMNQASGQPEGSYGSTYVTRPLFSTRTEWSWLVSNDFRNERIRRYVDTRVALFNARSTPERDALRDEYQSERFTETVAVTRSFGLEHKQDITLGMEMSRRAYHVPVQAVARFPDEVIRDYERARLPRSDTRVGPALRARFFETRFKHLLDFETLGLQEDVRLGYDVTLRASPVLEGLGSTRTFLGTYAAAQYTWAISDGIIRVGAELLNEFEEDRIADGAVNGDLRIHSPSLGIGRVVFDATVLSRYRNYLNRTALLGGEGRLRGYPTSFFSGKDFLSANLEFRSRSVKVISVLLGMAAFMDVGHAFDGFDQMRPQQSTGLGLRILFPQFDRVVFRADAAVPITHHLPPDVSRSTSSIGGVPLPTFFIAFEQGFAFTTTGGPVSPTGGTSAGLLGQ